jgi:toxin ParE1/3/4
MPARSLVQGDRAEPFFRRSTEAIRECVPLNERQIGESGRPSAKPIAASSPPLNSPPLKKCGGLSRTGPDVRIRKLARALANWNAEAEYIAREKPQAAVLGFEAFANLSICCSGISPLGRPGTVAGTRELVVSGTRYIVPYRVRGNEIATSASFSRCSQVAFQAFMIRGGQTLGHKTSATLSTLILSFSTRARP